MMFNSFGFVLFFSILLLVILIFEKTSYSIKGRNIILLIASFIYYLIFNWKCFFILFLLIASTYICSIKIDNKIFAKIGIAMPIIILFVFKYYNFFIGSFTGDNDLINLILPVGLSFYTFRCLSYLFDVKKGKIKVEKNVVYFSLYIAYFPEIVAGPISRSQKLIPQFKEKKKLNLDNLSEGLQIYLIGLFKKIVLADNINTFVSTVYANPNIYSSLTILLCVIAYSIEIYMDFSGYSDMAIGCSKMLGFDIDKNFNLPYMSKNVSEFWHRWHISLSTWLSDYIYIPLGGNRKGKIRQYINLLITMVIAGLWHGANWTFACWGLINGFALVMHKIITNSYRKINNVVCSVQLCGDTTVSIITTFFFISLTWVPFRADSISNAIEVIRKLFSFSGGISYMSTWSIFAILVVLVSSVFAYKKNNGQSYYPIQDLSTTKGLFILFLFVGLIIGLANTGSNPFIYAAF